MRLLAIDPGPTKSAFVVLDGNIILESNILPNDAVASLVDAYAGGLHHGVKHLAVEMVQSFGMAVGAEVFETVLWTGRFIGAWEQVRVDEWSRVYRKDVKMHLCGNMRAKDANIRQALIDRFGGKEAAIGTKKSKGPLWGIKSDLWSALAIGITWLETRAA